MPFVLYWRNGTGETTNRLVSGVGGADCAGEFCAGTRAEQLVAAAGSALGLRVPTGALDMSSVQETYRQLKAHYDGSLDDQALIDGAKRGLVAAAGVCTPAISTSRMWRSLRNR